MRTETVKRSVRDEIEVARVKVINNLKKSIDGSYYTDTRILVASTEGQVFEIAYNDSSNNDRSELIDLLLLTEPGDKLELMYDQKVYGPLNLEKLNKIVYAKNLDLKIGKMPTM